MRGKAYKRTTDDDACDAPSAETSRSTHLNRHTLLLRLLLLAVWLAVPSIAFAMGFQRARNVLIAPSPPPAMAQTQDARRAVRGLSRHDPAAVSKISTAIAFEPRCTSLAREEVVVRIVHFPNREAEQGRVQEQ